MGTGGAGAVVLAGKYAEIRPHMDERTWRLYLGSEARAFAAGGGAGWWLWWRGLRGCRGRW